MAGKIFIPSTINPLNPPPSGHYLLWIDDQGFFKKMDSNGNITNLSAQSLNDLNDTTLSTLEDGQILVYDQNTDKWVNQDLPDIDGKEDDLGLPDADSYVLASQTDGTRYWTPMTGGDSVDPTRVLNDDGATVVHGTTEGVQLKDKNETVRQSVNTSGSTMTGALTIKQAQSNDFLKYVCTNDDKNYMQMIDFGDKMKWRQKFGKPLIFQSYSDDNSQVDSMFELNYNTPEKIKFYQQAHFNKGAVLADANNVNWLIGGEVNGRKTLYVKTDPFQNNLFTANYGKGFIFKIDSNVDTDDSSNDTAFSISTTYIVSHKKHRFYNGIDMQYKRVEFLGDPEQPRDAVTKSYVDSSRISTLVDLEDVGSAGVGIQEGDTVEWDAGEEQFKISAKSVFDQEGVFNAGIDLKNTTLQNLATPIAESHAATKGYVDSMVSGGGTLPTALFNTDDKKILEASTYGFKSFSNSGYLQLETDGTELKTYGLTSARVSSGGVWKLYNTNTNETIQDHVLFSDNYKIKLQKDFPLKYEAYSSDSSQYQPLLEMSYTKGIEFTVKPNATKGITLSNNNSVNWLEAGETNGRKSLYAQTDPMQNNQFTANYGKGFVFKVDDNINSSSSQNETIFSLAKTQISSSKKHAFYAGVDLQNNTIENLADPVADTDAVNKQWFMANLSGGTSSSDLFDENGDVRLHAETSGAACYGRLRIRQLSNNNWLEFKSEFADDTNPLHEKYLFKMLHKNSINYFESRYNQNFVFKVYDSNDQNANEVLRIERGKIVSKRKHYFENEADFGSKRLINVGSPEFPNDAVNRAYVDGLTYSAGDVYLDEDDYTWQSVGSTTTLQNLLESFDGLIANFDGISEDTITFPMLKNAAYSEDLNVSADCEELVTAMAAKNYVDATMADKSTRREFLSTSFVANTPLSFNHGLQKKLVIAQVFDSDGNSVEFHQKCVDNENVHLTIAIDGVFDVLVLG